MTDTPPQVEALYRRMLMSRSPAERFRMGCRMFTTAKTLTRAGLLHQHGPLDEVDIRRLIFLRLYGDDFPSPQRERIAELVARAGG